MKKLVFNSLEILFSLFIVGGLLFVAFYVKPTATVDPYQPTVFSYRDNYFGVTTVSDDHNIIWAVGRNGRIIHSNDLGQSWRIQNSLTNNHLQDISLWNEDLAMVAGDQGTVLLTSDGGENWNRVDLPVREFGDQLLSTFVDKQTNQAWISGTMGSVFKSIDTGQTWQMTHEEEDVAWNDVIVDAKNWVWLAGEFGRLQRSIDDGNSWIEIQAPTESSLMSIAFANEKQGVAVGISGAIIYTEDGGETWNKLDDVTDASLFTVIWDGQQYVAAGLNGVILKAGVGGKDWQVGKIEKNNFAWYTQISSHKGKYYIAGANLGVLDETNWQVFQ